ncbi:Carboxyl-terminal protease [hydrothermal vent metagenome]|uniref:Carboxyl-terminal protease n=1 Tax=hydrothermal vent metagenome TaxID=652676 RepID=A0A3B0ZWN1_9ZZZZ
MNNFTRNTLILTTGLIAGITLAIGIGVHAERGSNGVKTIPIEDIRSLSEVFGKIKDNYVEDVTDKELLENAIRGMMTGLDPHSTYLDKEAFKELRVGTSGEFGGLGIVVGMEDGFVKVISPIDDTPASRAGIKAGDLIIRLDKKPVKGMSLDDAVKIMRGRPGTEIELLIVREGADKPLTYHVTRDKIRVKSVKSKTLEKGFGYVRVSQFQERSSSDLKKAISKLKKDNNGKLNGIVLDLRNNPGGLLDSAVEISDIFITKGGIVSVKGREEGSKIVHSATPADMLDGAPIVVLVNGGSASASEIVAGALQDHKRAIVMGSKTFGKGSVQTVVPLGNNTAIKLTTARYYTPSGRSIQAKGIDPDIIIRDVKLTENDKKNIEQIKEVDLHGHLENEKNKAKKGDKGKKEDNGKKLLSEDYALYEALNLLKGLYLVSQR